MSGQHERWADDTCLHLWFCTSKVSSVCRECWMSEQREQWADDARKFSLPCKAGECWANPSFSKPGGQNHPHHFLEGLPHVYYYRSPYLVKAPFILTQPLIHSTSPQMNAPFWWCVVLGISVNKDTAAAFHHSRGKISIWLLPKSKALVLCSVYRCQKCSMETIYLTWKIVL